MGWKMPLPGGTRGAAGSEAALCLKSERVSGLPCLQLIFFFFGEMVESSGFQGHNIESLE